MASRKARQSRTEISASRSTCWFWLPSLQRAFIRTTDLNRRPGGFIPHLKVLMLSPIQRALLNIFRCIWLISLTNRSQAARRSAIPKNCVLIAAGFWNVPPRRAPNSSQPPHRGVSHAKWCKAIRNRTSRLLQSGMSTDQRKRRLFPASRPVPKGFQSTKRNYERNLALARAEAQIGNTVAAESYPARRTLL